MRLRISARVSLINFNSNGDSTSKGGCVGIDYVIFSRNTSNSLNAGSFYLNANNATSNANANIDSGDLLHKTNIVNPCLFAGRTNNYTPLCVGRITSKAQE